MLLLPRSYADGREPALETHRVIYAPPPPPLLPGCKDRHANCAVWAEEGECDTNPSFMLTTCQAACARCDLMTDEDRAAAVAGPQQQ